MLLYAIVTFTVILGALGSPQVHKVTDGPRIINGTDAQPGQHPYQVSLQQFGSHFCAASIYNKNWCITASHCVDGLDVTNTEIVAGSVLLSEEGVRVKVKSYIQHEDYDANNNWKNDIALLELETPLEFNDFIQPVQQMNQQEDTPARTPVTVAGWGLTNDSWTLPNHLQTVNILTFSDQECRDILSDTIHDSQICAGLPEGNKGECNGDSGGALVSNGHQVGIVSWSYKPCTKPPYPSGVYTQTSYYIDWIKARAGESGAV